MTKILQATYSNGNLVLNEKLSPALEGKQVKVTILELETDEQSTDEQIHPTDEAEDTEPRITRARVLQKWAKRYAARRDPNYECDRQELSE